LLFCIGRDCDGRRGVLGGATVKQLVPGQYAYHFNAVTVLPSRSDVVESSDGTAMIVVQSPSIVVGAITLGSSRTPQVQ
jgi:hypothetical protein